ncbi:MAG: PAS domain S-box protein [Ignavibacteriae bacterium]|nr:PAS domain S-box protein [Ignavibacteriota bacterium]
MYHFDNQNMNGKINNILKLICGMNGSNYGVLLKISSNGFSIRAAHGNLDLNDISLKTFCEDLRITQNFDPSQVIFLESYIKLAEQNNIQSLGIKEVFKSERFILLLLCFSSEKEMKDVEVANMDTASEMIYEFLEEEKTFSTEANLESTIENANLAVLFSDNKGNPVYTNNRFRETFNLKGVSHFNNELFKLFDEEGNYIENFDYPYQIAARNNKSLNDRTYKFINDKGEEKWFRVNSILVPDMSNDDQKILTTFEDITTVMDIKQRMKAEMAPPDVVYYSSDPSGTEYSFISDSAKKMFGYLPEEIFDNRYMIASRIFSEYLDKFKNFIRDLSRGSQLAIEYKIRDAKNKTRFVRHLGIPVLENYEVVKIVGVISDITNEKKITEKLLFAEEKLNLIFENSDEFIFSLNENFEFDLVNQLGARFLGYEPEELIGCSISDYLKDDNKKKLMNVLKEVSSSDELLTFTANFRARNHKTVQIKFKAKTIQCEGIDKTILGVGRNISEYQKDELKIKELSEKLNNANKIIENEKNKVSHHLNVSDEINKLKNDFISNISHELRTPLTSIVGFAETIASDSEIEKNMIQEFGKVILEEGQRLSRLIDEILDFSEYESGLRKLVKIKFNVVDMLEQLVDSVREQFDSKNIKLTIVSKQNHLDLIGDRITLYKAFDNLLSNAYKFTDIGGKVEIIVNDIDEAVEFIVADNGVGIHEADISILFQKFKKLSRTGSQIPGAGFGLVTVQQIIDMHFGTIGIESKLNQGTKIIIRIPKNLTVGEK